MQSYFIPVYVALIFGSAIVVAIEDRLQLFTKRGYSTGWAFIVHMTVQTVLYVYFPFDTYEIGTPGAWTMLYVAFATYLMIVVEWGVLQNHEQENADTAKELLDSF